MAAKKSNTTAKPAAAAKKTGVAKVTAVRNSAIPKVVAAPIAVAAPAAAPIAAPRRASLEQIAERAYFIGVSGQGGSNDDNWFRAERELNSGI